LEEKKPAIGTPTKEGNPDKEFVEEAGTFLQVRVFSSPLKIILSLVAVGLSCFHLYTGAFGNLYVMFQRCIHIGLASILVFALFPFSKSSPKNRLTFIDGFFILLSIAVYAYPIVAFDGMVNRQGMPNTMDLIFGGVAILVVLESCRRVIGLSVSIIAVILLLYAYYGPYIPGMLGHRPFSLSRIIGFQYMTTEGIFGIPLGVSSTFVFLFVLFGAFVIKCGLGKFFTDLAMSVAGGLPGGPAKVAVVASGFEGMISGSSVANVVGSGSFTIPLMKRIGYPPHFAGAVEAVASTGGQFMPPVMGAGAFIMADFLGMPYTHIALLAFIPACLYYFGCYMQIHFRAKKLGMVGVPRAQLPSLWGVLRRKGHLLIPVATLVYFLLNNYSTTKVAFLAIMATIIVGFLQRGEDRFTLRSLYEALETGARTALGVAVATACAGIIVGVITMTGLGLKFSVLIIDISQGIPLLTMVLAAVACLIMGLGVPVTASYIIVATIVAPAMVKIGILPIAAHLFVFYFAVLADITPPECIAAFVAAGIAGANPMKTGVTAFRLGIAAFIVPFIFCFDSSLLGLGTVPEVAYRILVSIGGVIALAAVGELYLMRRSRWYETAMLGGAAALLLLPGWIDDLIGAALLGAVIFMQYLRNRKEASLSPALGS